MHQSYTLPEASNKTGLSYILLYRAIRRGVLPATRFGTQYSITVDDLNAFVESRREKAGKVIPSASH